MTYVVLCNDKPGELVEVEVEALSFSVTSDGHLMFNNPLLIAAWAPGVWRSVRVKNVDVQVIPMPKAA